MPDRRSRVPRAFLLLVLAGSTLLVACDAASFGALGQQSRAELKAQARGIRGQVLDPSGAPAAGVLVRGTLLSNNSGSLISNNGGGLVSNGGGLYRIQSGGFEAYTAEDGTFAFNTSDDQVLTVEARQGEGMKAIKLGVAAASEPFKLELAPTGHIQGQVRSVDPGITDLLNVDVFIPGTSYVAKTDAQGNFTLSNVPRGKFTLVADHPDLGRALIKDLEVVSGQTLKPPTLSLTTRTPVLSKVSPADGAPGSVITLSGDHFGASSGKRPEVLLNGVSAQVVSATDTLIKAVVPLGSVSGDVRVAVSGLESANQPFRVLRRLDLFPDYRVADAADPVAQPPATDVLAIGASRRYHVRAFDTEGRLVASPSVSWSTLGSDGTGFSQGKLTPAGTGRLAIAAVSGSLSSGPIAVELIPRVVRVDVLPSPIAPLNPLPPDAIPEDERSSIPDWVQLKAKVVLEGGEARELPILWQALDPRLAVTAGGLVTARPGATDGDPVVTIVPVADPAKRLDLPVPVRRQGDLSFVID